MTTAARGRRERLAAYVLIVVLAAIGFWRVERLQHEACERGNDFRAEDMPAAFDRFARNLGVELAADPDRIEEFIVEFDDDLEELFPTKKC
jgi:hypothetical protein